MHEFDKASQLSASKDATHSFFCYFKRIDGAGRDGWEWGEGEGGKKKSSVSLAPVAFFAY